MDTKAIWTPYRQRIKRARRKWVRAVNAFEQRGKHNVAPTQMRTATQAEIKALRAYHAEHFKVFGCPPSGRKD